MRDYDFGKVSAKTLAFQRASEIVSDMFEFEGVKTTLGMKNLSAVSEDDFCRRLHVDSFKTQIKVLFWQM